MRNRRSVFLWIVLGFGWLTGADEKTFSVRPYGFVATDLFYDTRQVFAARENFVPFWPLRKKNDPFCIDINSHGGWNLTPIYTRLGLKGECPKWRDDVFAKGVIESDFLGVAEAFTGTLRLRLAYAELTYKKWIFRAGQYWHPLFVLDCFPDTISFDNGNPIEPVARDPQVQVNYKDNDVEVILMAASQRGFSSVGPIGFSTEYIRNAVTPNFHGQARFFPYENTVFGVALDYKRLAPRIESDTGYSVKESINSIIVQAYGAYHDKRLDLCSKILYGENGSDQVLLSGFAIKTREPITNKQTYSNTAVFSWWLDTAYWFCEKTRSIGLFAGYTKNLGSRDDLFIDPKTEEPIVFALDPTIDYVARLAPRFRYKYEAFQVGIELEWTRAAFGPLTQRARVINACPVDNVRFLFEVLYFF